MPRLAALLKKLSKGKEYIHPLLPSINIFRVSKRILRAPNMLHPCIIVIGQGMNMGFLDKETYPFDEGYYLVLSQPLPFEFETYGSSNYPVLGVSISINLTVLHDIVTKIEKKPNISSLLEFNPLRGMGSVPLNKEMAESVERLLKCLLNPNDTRVLGPCLLREVIYCALLGPYGSALFKCVEHNTNFERIARVLRFIQNSFSTQLEIKELAKMATMSVSAFHKAFREITSESPIQYIKKVRLNKARELLATRGINANVVADKVGFSSASQFSREYKRYFGYSPSQTKANW